MRTLCCLALFAAARPGLPSEPPASGPQAAGRVNRVEHVARAVGGGVEIRARRTRPPDPHKATLAEPEIVPGEWTAPVVVPLAPKPVALFWADLDADGSDELVAGSTAGLTVVKRQPDGAWKAGPAEWPGSRQAWRRHIIAEGYMNQTAIAGDFTGDGMPDVIATGAREPRTILYVAPDWKPVTLQTRTQAIHSEAMDVDADGDLDYIAARYSPGFIFWLENPGGVPRGPWPLHLIDAAEQGGVNGVHGVMLGDIDRDGKLDLVANSAQPAGAFPNSLAWFRIPADPRARWRRHVFAAGDAPGLSHYHGIGDVNGDGRPDIASAAKIEPDGNWFAWWEQPATPGRPWTKHIISPHEPGATNILIADVNGDGRNDFIASRGHGVGLVWFENPHWTPHQINDRLIGPHSLAAGDIDGDGDLDAVTCAKDSHIAAWFENDGQGRFTTHHIHENQASYDIRLVDMDGDGDLDVLNAGQESRNVVWFENRLAR